MAEAYGVGRSHVREALRRLEAQHLVRRVPQSGNYVMPISARLVREGGFIRQSVEEANLRNLAASVTDAQLAALDALIARQEEAAAAPDGRGRFHALDEAFHEELLRAAGHEQVWGFLQPSKLHVDRARIATLGLASSAGRAIEEHKAIVAALRMRDADGATAALRNHLQTIDVLLEKLDRLEPEYVEHD